MGLLGKIKLSMLLACSIFLLTRAAREFLVYGPEDQPSRMNIDRLQVERGNKRWLTVEGRWAVSHARIRPSSSNRRVNIFVPVVSAEWQPTDPVSALVVVKSADEANAQRWIATNIGDAPRTFTGSTAPPGVWDCERIFPDLDFTDGVVVIYEGQNPPGSREAYTMLILGLVTGVLPVVYLVRLFWPRPPSATAAA